MAVAGRKADDRLVSLYADASGEDYDIYCKPCDLSDLRLPAFGFCDNCKEHLCKSCFDKHKQTEATRIHSLLDKHSMPLIVTPLQTTASDTKNIGLSIDSTAVCSIHAKEPIRFYCSYHGVVVCKLCVAYFHEEKSCKVSVISLICHGILESNEYTDSLQTLNVMVDKCMKLRNDIRENARISDNSLKNVLKDIKQFKDDMNRALDYLGSKIEEKVKRQQLDHADRLKRAETLCGDITESLKHAYDSIKHHKETNQTDKLFTTIKTSQQLVEVSEKKMLDLLSADHAEQYHFKPNLDLQSIIRNANTLGTVEYFSQEKEIYAKTQHDDMHCYVRGMTLLSDSKLVILDANNHSIKLVDLCDNSILYQLQTGGNLTDMTKINSDQVAVTVFEEQTILFLTASSSKLSMKNSLKLEGFCEDITSANKKLAVTFPGLYPSGYFQVMDFKGKVFTKVKIGNPKSISSDERHIYVYDINEDAVNIYDWLGKLIRKPRCRNARSLTLLDDGSLYTVSRNSGTVTHTSGDFTNSNVVITDLAKPTNICWSETNSLLYINRNTEDENYDNIINVYKRFLLPIGPRVLSKEIPSRAIVTDKKNKKNKR